MELAAAVSVSEPVDADAGIVSGAAVTPDGSPVTVTLTLAAGPVRATSTVTLPDVPRNRCIPAGDRLRVTAAASTPPSPPSALFEPSGCVASCVVASLGALASVLASPPPASLGPGSSPIPTRSAQPITTMGGTRERVQGKRRIAARNIPQPSPSLYRSP